MTGWSPCPGVESIPGKHSGDWLFNGTKLPMYSLFENLAGELSSTTSWNGSTPWRNRT